MGGTLRIGPATKSGHGVPLVPSKRPFRERVPDQRYGRTLGKRTVAAVAIDAGPQEGVATEKSVTVGNGLYLPGWIEGNGVSFLVDTGSGVSILAAQTWRKWGRAEDGLTRYWGRLCSVEGRALECLGKARLTVTLGTQVIEWSFIVAEIGDDEGILGNDFAMAHELTVRPCEGAVYLPDLAGTGKGHMGERLPCTIRAVTEVRAVTEKTLAVMEKTLNTLGGARFFCSLDLASGYWQVEMDAADREKTAFVTQGGLYEFRVMPFGLVNAPATFERLMEPVLRGNAWSECLVYLDDILVFGPDFGTTLARLESVLDRLGEAGLKLKAKKCQLFQEEIPFLGHIVSAAGIGADPAKCQQVRDWPVPRDLHEVRSFVGLCSYYGAGRPLIRIGDQGNQF